MVSAAATDKASSPPLLALSQTLRFAASSARPLSLQSHMTSDEFLDPMPFILLCFSRNPSYLLSYFFNDPPTNVLAFSGRCMSDSPRCHAFW